MSLGSDAQLHEAILTRGDVAGAKGNVPNMIFHRCNCVHLHPACHVPGHLSEENFRKCVDYLVFWESREAIEEYLVFMANNTKLAGRDALQKFNSYMQEKRYGI